MTSYSYRPVYGVNADGEAFQRQAEARAVTRAGYEENAHLPDVDSALKQTATGAVPLLLSPATGGDGMPRDAAWAPWLGRPLKSGAYGSAFRLRYSGEVEARLEAARATASFRMEHSRVPAGAVVVVKIARGVGDKGQPVSQSAVDLFARDSVRESSWHRRLASSACIKVPGAARPACPASHVPAFHWGGMVTDAFTGRRYYLTVMGLAPGITVNEYVKRRRMTAPLYVAIEHAVVTMWLAGVAHSDFHKGNQLYEPASGKLTIIDFGMGMLLPERLVGPIRKALAPAIAQGVRSLGELWRSSEKSEVGLGVQGYANRLMYTREQARLRARAARGRRANTRVRDLWYNPDGHALRQMYNQLSAREREEVPIRRRQMWGVGPSAAAPAKQAALAAALASRLPSPRRSRGSSSRSSRTRLGVFRTSRRTSRRSGRTSGPSPMDIDSRSASGGIGLVSRVAKRRHVCSRGSKYDAMRRLCVAAAIPLT